MSEISSISSVVIINDESQLPTGKIISSAGEELEVSEKNRKELIVWDVSSENRKQVWVLSVKSAYNSVAFMQLLKNAENKEYKVVKKGLIDPAFLSLLYDKKAMIEQQKSNSGDSKAIERFESVIAYALKERISDVHIEVRPSGGVIRMRKNGEMTEYDPENRLSSVEANNLCSVVYNVLASTKAVSFDPRDCQQAAVNYNIEEQELKLRYQSVPAYPDGYDVILRVLPIGRSEDFTPLQHLGYTDQQVKQLLNIAGRPVGSLIIAGVTGSGKSTTMKNLLMYINAYNSFKLKIFSIEDPPEYNIARITQIPVVIGKDFDPTKMSPFEKPIKACMRGDPDIIMIGEVRDKISGDLTKKAVQSGHQVLTTVHATSALGIIDRFMDFGLQRTVLGSPDFLTGLLYQKLLGVVCKTCAINFSELVKSSRATEEEKGLYERLKTVCNPEDHKIFIRNEKGCPECGYSGIKGRTVCAEVVSVDMQMQQLILDGNNFGLMDYWRGLSDKDPASTNMMGKTCMEHAFQKALNGLCCPKEVESAFKPIDEMLWKSSKLKNDGE